MKKGSEEDFEQLEDYFSALRQEDSVASPELVDAILRDARRYAPVRAYAELKSSAATLSIWEIIISFMGGRIQAAALAASVLAGIGLGYGTIDYIGEIAMAQAEFDDGGNEIFAALDELLAAV